jgi:glycerol-3-phosphate O-acyltransferase / dihydroxyacetone phosphate acyltransferase
VNFGEPIRAADFLQGYEERRHECVHALTAEIERHIQSLILHLPSLEHARVVAGVKRLHLERLRLGHSIAHEAISPRAEELLVTQGIVAAVERVYKTEPERAAAFVAKLDVYERRLRRLRISDEHLAMFPNKGRLMRRSMGGAALAVLGAPVALYGWVHRAIPYAVVKWAVRNFTQRGKRKAQTSAVAILAGMISFGVLYGSCVAGVHAWLGWPVSLWYALSLPVASLIAHYYLRELRRLGASLRNAFLLLLAPKAARRLLAMRAELVAEIGTVRGGMRER